MGHTLEDVERHGRDLHQPYAAEAAHNRELRDQLAQAKRDADAKATRLATDEAAFADLAYMARLSGDQGAYAKQKAKLDALTAEKYESARFAAWLTQQVEESDARLVDLEEQAAAYLGQVARPMHEEAVSEIDAALEAMISAFNKEQRIRSVFHGALRVRGRPYSDHRLGRYITALGSLSTVGPLGRLEDAVETWRSEARADRPASRYKVHGPATRAEIQARRTARQAA